LDGDDRPIALGKEPEMSWHKRIKEPTTPSSAPEVGRQRVQLDFTPEAIDRLREIKELAGAKTNAEVVRNALRLYEWFLRQKKENYTIQLVKDNWVKEVEIIL
jgi:hypothetical protein